MIGFQDTVSILSPIPASIELLSTNTTGIAINFLTDPSDATFDVSSNNTDVLIEKGDKSVTITASSSATGGSAIVKIVATKEGYAPNQRRIKVLVVGA